MEEAGLPAGVLNFLPMSREGTAALTAEIIGNPLVRNVNVRDISYLLGALETTELTMEQFTGGDRVGKIIAMEAAKYLKPCILELGGKAPAVVSFSFRCLFLVKECFYQVLNDANIAEAAKGLVFGALANSGQVSFYLLRF